MDTNDKGEYALLKVKMIALDCGERLVRAQVKYTDGKNAGASGSALLNLRKITRGNKRGRQCYTEDEVDVLLVYLPKIDKVLWLETPYFHGRTAIVIRFEPSKNNQTKRCLMAQDFLW